MNPKPDLKLNPKTINTTALAYIGDAVYEIYVREHVLKSSCDGTESVSFGARFRVRSAADGSVVEINGLRGFNVGLRPIATENIVRATGI